MNSCKLFPPLRLFLCSAAMVSAAAAGPHTITLETLSSVRTTPRNNGATPPVLSPPGAAFSVVHDPCTQRLFVVNQTHSRIDVINIADPDAPAALPPLDMSSYGPMTTSVAVHGGLLAVSVTGPVITDNGVVVFFDRSLRHVKTVPVGPLPDMITFTPNGDWLMVANEGEATPDYLTDPEGSLTRIDIKKSFKTTNIGFGQFDIASLRAAGVRIFGPVTTAAQDLEPEYITVSNDSKTAWVTLQENNAVAVVDIRSAKVKHITALGTKDHSLPANALDASDRDGPGATGSINIRNWPVRGLYQPDGIESVRIGGDDFLVIANEGSGRDIAGPGNESARVGALTLDPVLFPNAASLKLPEQLGRLNVSMVTGDTDGDGDMDEIHAFGGRSFSILNSRGEIIWDSGAEFERKIAELYPPFFNTSNNNNRLDDRSDDKGPEPEGVAIGKAFGRHYAFISLERAGGVMVYDISTPKAPTFVEYANNRDFNIAPPLDGAGDLGAEGMAFIKGDDSPNGSPLLVVANEISGTTTLFEVVKVRK